MKKQTTVTIRSATPDDRAALERCFVELQTFEQGIEPNRVAGAPIAAAYIAELFAACETSSGMIFVAACDGAVAGFVCVLGQTHSGEIIERWPERAYITDLVVLSEYRRRGIGSALMRAAEDHAIGCDAQTLMLGVLAGNAPARALYRLTGFRESEVILKKAIGSVRADPAQ